MDLPISWSEQRRMLGFGIPCSSLFDREIHLFVILVETGGIFAACSRK